MFDFEIVVTETGEESTANDYEETAYDNLVGSVEFCKQSNEETEE